MFGSSNPSGIASLDEIQNRPLIWWLSNSPIRPGWR